MSWQLWVVVVFFAFGMGSALLNDGNSNAEKASVAIVAAVMISLIFAGAAS